MLQVNKIKGFDNKEIFCYNGISQQLSWNEDINMKIINKKECYHLNEILDDDFFNNRKNVSRAIDIFIKNLKSFKIDINSKNNKSILKKLIQTKKVRSKIIKLKQDVNKPDFGRD